MRRSKVADIDGSGGAEECWLGNNWLYDGAGQASGRVARADSARLAEPRPLSDGGTRPGERGETRSSHTATLRNPATGEWVYAVDVRQQDNSRFAGNWPAYLEAHIGRARVGSEFLQYSGIHARTAQLVSGGTREIVLCYDRIRVLAADGTARGGPAFDRSQRRLPGFRDPGREQRRASPSMWCSSPASRTMMGGNPRHTPSSKLTASTVRRFRPPTAGGRSASCGASTHIVAMSWD